MSRISTKQIGLEHSDKNKSNVNVLLFANGEVKNNADKTKSSTENEYCSLNGMDGLSKAYTGLDVCSGKL